jgi:processive 1,2-diacylglycerol beta-glucosyltransferase
MPFDATLTFAYKAADHVPMAARILIITAAFGEGHNSAARNMALALQELGAEAKVADPCMLGAPVSTKYICMGYRLITTYAPRLWYRVYMRTDGVDFTRQRFPLMRKPERKLGELLDTFQPDAVVCTYPLYPYFLQRLLEGKAKRPLVVTVVTDSIEINAAWLKAPTDAWLVTDPLTADAMVRAGLPAEKVVDTGFPVNPCFSRLDPVAADASVDPFRVLFFATPNLPQLRRISRAVLEASPDTKLTLVLGKNLRLLYHISREISREFPGRVKIIGWTRRVPQLLNRHHLVIGKAGGATVHEAIAARCPMLVHHLVPGQEEGNLRLLEKIGGGMLAASSEAIRAAIADLLADGAGRWRSMKRRLGGHGRNAGAISAANYVLERIEARKTTD